MVFSSLNPFVTRFFPFRVMPFPKQDEVNGAVRTGKEAVVYHAVGSLLPVEGADAVPGFAPGEAKVRGATTRESESEEECSEVVQGAEAVEVGSSAAAPSAAVEEGDVRLAVQVAEAATGGEEEEEESDDPVEFALKVFKTTLTEFKNRLAYVEGDHRFKTMKGLSHQNPRE